MAINHVIPPAPVLPQFVAQPNIPPVVIPPGVVPPVVVPPVVVPPVNNAPVVNAPNPNSTIAGLSQTDLTALYNQVGDAMYNPGFNYTAHIAGNTVNGVFVPPVNNVVGVVTPPVTNTPVVNAPVVNAPLALPTISGLSQAQLTALNNQVGDAMYAPGFNYAAHIAGNTVNGVFVAPVYIPANTSTILTAPATGSTAYQQLLVETGGASAKAGFNYAAHLAATVSQVRTDMSYEDVMRVIVETGKTDFSNFDLSSYRATTGSKVGLGNEFANTTAAKVAVNQIQQSVTLKTPTVGSAEYQALSLETGGASERPGFNYVAHVAANTSQKVLTSLSYSEVVSLIAQTGKTDFKNFDLVSYQKEKVVADALITRFVADPIKTAPTTPVVGSADYQAILKETGLKDLAGFDYAAHLSAKRTADLVVTTLQGSAADDVITAAIDDVKHIFVAGAGNDKVSATGAADILIGGAGNDTLDGGAGLDKAVFTGALADYKLNLANNQALTITDAQATRDGVDSLKNVERLSFSDVSVALDIGKDQTAGSGYMLYKAAFNRTPDLGGLGFWINKMDTGAGYSSVAQSFVSSTEFQAAFGGSNPSVNTLVTKLYTNVLNRAADTGGIAFWQDKLTTGGWTTADVLGYFSTSGENVTNVTPLIANGISYKEWVA